MEQPGTKRDTDGEKRTRTGAPGDAAEEDGRNGQHGAVDGGRVRQEARVARRRNAEHALEIGLQPVTRTVDYNLATLVDLVAR